MNEKHKKKHSKETKLFKIRKSQRKIKKKGRKTNLKIIREKE